MLKLSSALWGFRRMPLDEIIKLCPSIGLKRLEAHLHPDVPLHFRLDMSKKEVDAILSLAKDNGVSFPTMATANDFTISPERTKKDLEYLRKAILFAKKIDAPIIRVFSGFSPREKVRGKSFDSMVAALSDASKFAGDNGMTLALENHGGIAASADDMLRMLSEVDSPSLLLNFDPANFVHAGEDCIKAFKTLKSKVVYVHLKDVKLLGDKKEYCAAGEGCIDWRTLLPMLESDYAGVCAIEYESEQDPADGTSRSLKFISSLINID